MTMSTFGVVRQVRMTPKSTFAFVEFDTVQEAVHAVEACKGFVCVSGTQCSVSWATKRKRKGRKPKNSNSPNSSANINVNINSNAAAKDSAMPIDSSDVGNSSSSSSSSSGKKKKVNLCNLYVETGACSWGNNCKYLHDPSRRKNHE